MNSIDVAVGIIWDSTKSKVLVAQRKTQDEHYGQWEFPGGKINFGESVQAALMRELHEELGIDVLSFHLFERLDYEYPRKNVSLYFHIVTKFTGEARGKEGQKIKWQEINQLQDLEMLEANRGIIQKLNKI